MNGRGQKADHSPLDEHAVADLTDFLQIQLNEVVGQAFSIDQRWRCTAPQ